MSGGDRASNPDTEPWSAKGRGNGLTEPSLTSQPYSETFWNDLGVLWFEEVFPPHHNFA